jgi:hypothetical protein
MWRRWNKNLLVHGPRFGAWTDVEGLLVAAIVYAAPVVLLTLVIVIGPLAAAAAPLLFAVAVAGRWRRLAAGARLAGLSPSLGLLLRTPFYAAIDMLGVFAALVDASRQTTRDRW